MRNIKSLFLLLSFFLVLSCERTIPNEMMYPEVQGKYIEVNTTDTWNFIGAMEGLEVTTDRNVEKYRISCADDILVFQMYEIDWNGQIQELNLPRPTFYVDIEENPNNTVVKFTGTGSGNVTVYVLEKII